MTRRLENDTEYDESQVVSRQPLRRLIVSKPRIQPKYIQQWATLRHSQLADALIDWRSRPNVPPPWREWRRNGLYQSGRVLEWVDGWVRSSAKSRTGLHFGTSAAGGS